MKALSVKQPWATKIASGKKKIEYRTWRTRYRGDLLIVASRNPKIKGYPSGVAMCIVELVDCRPIDGGYAWILKNPRPVPPIPVKGRLGIYDVERGTRWEDRAK